MAKRFLSKQNPELLRNEKISVYSLAGHDYVAEARLSAAIETVNSVGVQSIHTELEQRVDELLDLADEFHLPILTPRQRHERAGLVTVMPDREQLNQITASLHNFGITADTKAGIIRFSPHLATDSDTFDLLRQAMVQASH